MAGSTAADWGVELVGMGREAFKVTFRCRSWGVINVRYCTETQCNVGSVIGYRRGTRPPQLDEQATDRGWEDYKAIPSARGTPLAQAIRMGLRVPNLVHTM